MPNLLSRWLNFTFLDSNSGNKETVFSDTKMVLHGSKTIQVNKKSTPVNIYRSKNFKIAFSLTYLLNIKLMSISWHFVNIVSKLKELSKHQYNRLTAANLN